MWLFAIIYAVPFIRDWIQQETRFITGVVVGEYHPNDSPVYKYDIESEEETGYVVGMRYLFGLETGKTYTVEYYIHTRAIVAAEEIAGITK